MIPHDVQRFLGAFGSFVRPAGGHAVEGVGNHYDFGVAVVWTRIWHQSKVSMPG